MKIYEIPHAIRAALDAMEIDTETGEILNADALHDVEAEATDKVESTALYLREYEAEIEATDAEINRLIERVNAMKRRRDHLKGQLLEAVQATGKVKTARVTVSIRRTSAVHIDDCANLPEAYVTTKTLVSPNRTAIKQALQSGVAVPFCSLEERESVIIR